MNPNTPPPSDDDLPDEQELAALYARLPRAEPDTALDAAVLAAAERAVPSRSTPARRRSRWPVALGSAAVLVLAVGVGWQLRNAPIRDPLSERAEKLAAPAPVPAAAPPAAAESEPVATPAAPPKLAAPAVGARLARDQARTTAAANKATPQRPAIVAQAKVFSAPMAPPEALPAPAPAAPPAPPSPPAPPAAIEPAPASADALRDAQPAPAPAEEAMYGFNGHTATERRADTPVMSAAPAPMTQGAIAAKPVVAGLAPDDRVGEIRRLLDQGNRAEALRKLAELRRLYPAYDLPQDLRDLKP